MVMTPDAIKSQLKQLGIRPDTHLGQHFLIDQLVLDQITETAQDLIADNDTIVEVGPGLGILTEALLAISQNWVISVEKDPVLSQFAQHKFKNDRLQLITGDILWVLDQKQITELTNWVFIANIPYAITSPLIRKLINRANQPRDILILVQKESAERIVAPAGDSRRGFLSVLVEVQSEAHILQTISPSSFWPAPKVDSALLRLTPRPQALVPTKDQPDFYKVVQAGFSSKRKQLANSLSGGLRLPKETVIHALKQAEIAPSARAETLTIDAWQRLTKILLSSV